MAASCLAAFDILEREPERIERLHENTWYFKSGLKSAGFDTGASETPITPIMVGEAKRAHEFSAALFDEGLFSTGIGFPTVPQGKARIRTIVTAAHTREHLDRALAILTRVARRMAIVACRGPATWRRRLRLPTSADADGAAPPRRPLGLFRCVF